MKFEEALKKLNIEDFTERIFNSNSTGELHHLYQYVQIATVLGENNHWFRGWFEKVVKQAEEEWERPESVFQHILKIMVENLKAM